MADPLAYVLHRPPAKPVVPVRLAIIGPPKSGKTTCEYLSRLDPVALMMMII